MVVPPVALLAVFLASTLKIPPVRAPAALVASYSYQMVGHQEGRSNHLYAATGATLAIDHLAALLGLHACAESDGPGPLDVAGLMGVMHAKGYIRMAR